MSPKESSDKEDLEQSPSGSGQLCVGFRCHHCVCIIEEGQPVYMGRDASYCSADCRKRGRSAEYAQLMGIKQIEEDVPYDSASMYSSLVSESTTTSSKKTVEEDAGRGHRVLRWVLSAGIRHLNALAAGTELLRMGSFKTSVQPGWPAPDSTEDGTQGQDSQEDSCSGAGFSDIAGSQSEQEKEKGSCADFVRLIEGWR